MAEAGEGSTAKPTTFTQIHEKFIPPMEQQQWWYAVYICLSAIAVVANLIFVVTVIYNRRRSELKTFVTAVITTVAVLDILDVLRILPVLSQDMFAMEIYRHVYCSLGVFHELAVAIFIVAISVAVCVQAGKEKKLSIINDSRASLAHKILIPIVLLITAGAAALIYLFNYYDYAENWHSCTAPERALFVAAGTDSETFHFDLYSTLVSAFTYVFPVLIVPIVLPIASLRTCISRQCCVPRYKQPIGELVMTTMICIIYLGTVVGVILPRLDTLINEKDDYIKLEKAPLLWELANNAARPLCYFLTNPGVWDGIKTMCGCGCKKKHHLVSNDDMEEAELPLAP